MVASHTFQFIAIYSFEFADKFSDEILSCLLYSNYDLSPQVFREKTPYPLAIHHPGISNQILIISNAILSMRWRGHNKISILGNVSKDARLNNLSNVGYVDGCAHRVDMHELRLMDMALDSSAESCLFILESNNLDGAESVRLAVQYLG